MATGYLEANQMRIDFTDDTWIDAFPAVYEFTNTSSIPWKVDSTFQYENNPTLRSGAIRHNDTTTITLTFRLVENGSITFPYCITSENNYDWLTVKIDDAQVVRVSGSYNWTVYTKQLETGQHTASFTYSKDRSGSNSRDACAIGYIDLVGVPPNFNVYYLVHDLDTDKYYANVDGSLTEVSLSSPPTLQDFETYGSIIPTAGMLDTLTKFEILKCAATTEKPDKIPGVKFSLVGNVRPQLFKCINAVSITEQYQTGFDSISVDATKLDTTVIKLLISPDNATWYSYIAATDTEDAHWFEVPFTTEDALNNGISFDDLASIDAEAFNLLYTDATPKTMYIAFVVQCTELDDWCISNISVAFTTTK
jgi:hypothetical protein